MKRFVRQTEEQKLARTWWVKGLTVLILLGLTYGFASLAINSGRILEYVAGIFFLVWALREITQIVRSLFAR